MKRKPLPFLLSTALLLTLTGCSSAWNLTSGGTATPKTTAETKQGDVERDVKLRIAWWGGQARHDYTLKLIELYQQKNPHVKIDTEYAGFDDYWKKLAPQAAANQLPDIIQMDISYLGQYGSKEQLEDLTPLTNSGALNISSASSDTINTGRVDGKLYGIPLGINALGTIYDDEPLKQAGIPLIDHNWTWSVLEQINDKMKKQGKLLDHLRFDQFFPYYLRTQGQHYFNADGTSLGYSDNKYFIEYYKMYKRWYDAGYMRTWDKEALSKLTPEENPIALGDGFMTMAWSNQFVTLQQASKKPLQIMGPPGPNQKQGLYLKPTMLFSISKSSKQKEEAAKFISWFINDLDANMLIKGDRGIPISSKVKEGLKPSLRPEEQQVYEYVAWAEQNSSVMEPPDPTGAAEVSKLLKDMQEQILYNKISVEEAAAKFKNDANAILAKNKK
ncbi:ABC transporter substrate-binding protein [Paenibacillus sedimenti]|uniref:Carbohydrate ABC transporter substrate-binding protein n=1 Tax=Paenibacillus sedimenti TaxID=2770274 RepID=A0A926KJZ5_9BACL|nr:ABC transporter substrate-binding protein [Paenibacillus sedimenti]MBD0379020.1 carbohydrate ABC transporter substrate-binding protein [Paenibacillus sedimenti]